MTNHKIKLLQYNLGPMQDQFKLSKLWNEQNNKQKQTSCWNEEVNSQLSSSAVPALFEDGDIEETMETSIHPNTVVDNIIVK